MKTCSLVVLCFLFSSCTCSQIWLGVKGGLNAATVRYMYVENSRARLGWNAGVLAEVPIQSNLLIRPELLYSSKGFGFSATGTSNSGSVRFNYIAVPVLFGYRPSKKSEILLGPEFGFLRKAVSKSVGISSDVTNFYRHFDLGFDLGFAYNFTKALGAEIRYNYGFKDLVNVAFIDENGDITGQGRNGANRVLQFGMYYMFD